MVALSWHRAAASCSHRECIHSSTLGCVSWWVLHPHRWSIPTVALLYPWAAWQPWRTSREGCGQTQGATGPPVQGVQEILQQEGEPEEAPVDPPSRGDLPAGRAGSVSPAGPSATHQSIPTGQRPFCCGACGPCSCLRYRPGHHHRPHATAGPFSQSLSSRISLSAHTRTHGQGSPSVCAQCGRSFVERGTLVAHGEVNRREKPFECPRSSRCPGQRATLLAHQKVHLRRGPFICTKRGKGWSTKGYFSAHQRNHAKQKGHSSSVVQVKEEPDFGLRPEESVLENMAHEGDVAQGCSIPRNPLNPKNPPWKIQVKEEPEPPSDGTARTAAAACQKLHVKEEPPENPACGKLFDPKVPPPVLQGRQPEEEEDADGQHEWKVPVVNKRVLHMKEEAEESTDFGMCYGQKPNLSVIQRIQIKEEPGVEANRQQGQSPKRKQEKNCQSTEEENHKKSMSRNDPSAKGDPRGERTFPCPECGKSFNQKSNLTRHRKIHMSEGPYECGKCGESFRMSRELRRHKCAHLGEPFQCPECGKSFTQRSNLLRHQRIHTKEEPYQCPGCEKTFNQKANLFRHQTIHGRMGPCKCTKCGKCFPHKRHLIKHQLMHARWGAHKCGLCGKCYRLKKYLRRHQKIHSREGASPGSKFGENARTGPHHAEQRALGPVKSEGES